MKLRIAQPHIGNTVERCVVNDTSKGARNAITSIVGHYQQNVGRVLRRHDLRRPVRLRVFGVEQTTIGEASDVRQSATYCPFLEQQQAAEVRTTDEVRTDRAMIVDHLGFAQGQWLKPRKDCLRGPSFRIRSAYRAA